MRAWITRRPLTSFAILAFALSWLGAWPLILHARDPARWEPPEWWDVLLAAGPGIAAVIVMAATGGALAVRRFLAGCLDTRIGARAWALAVGAPVAIFAAALLVQFWLHGDWPATRSGAPLLSLAFLAPGLLAALSGPAEEPGWRGYALPRLLERHRPLLATLLLAALWIPWHLPMFFYRENFGIGQFGMFSFALLCGAIWLTQVHLLSGGKTFAAIAWHALWNFLASSARALEPSPFMWMTTAILAGALLILIRWAVLSRRSSAASTPRASSPPPDRA